MKNTLHGHVKETVALPGMLLTSLLWPLVPQKVRKHIFYFDGASGQPIICIPGYAHNNSCYILLMKRLQDPGLESLISYNYHPPLGSIEGYA